MIRILDTQYTLLFIFALFWCVLHSWLISNGVTHRLKVRMKVQYKYFRILYNLFSFLTLAGLIAYERQLANSLIFSWDVLYLQVIRIFLLAISLLLFYLGAKQYDGMEFLGLRQLKEGVVNKTLSASGEIKTDGVLGIIRHPWYTGGIIIIWLRPLYVSTLIVNLVFTAYFVVGAILEEKKLRAEFGDTYKTYQQNVSMLLPWKWLRGKIIDK